jgi:hypothetical protein
VANGPRSGFEDFITSSRRTPTSCNAAFPHAVLAVLERRGARRADAAVPRTAGIRSIWAMVDKNCSKVRGGATGQRELRLTARLKSNTRGIRSEIARLLLLAGTPRRPDRPEHDAPARRERTLNAEVSTADASTSSSERRSSPVVCARAGPRRLHVPSHHRGPRARRSRRSGGGGGGGGGARRERGLLLAQLRTGSRAAGLFTGMGGS